LHESLGVLDPFCGSVRFYFGVNIIVADFSILLHREGRLSRPQGLLTLTISANSWIRTRLLYILSQIPDNA
jgi:hypothetical protein